MNERNNGLSLHDKALAVTASMIKQAQETGMSLYQGGFLSPKNMKSGKPLIELLIFFINLWIWYEAEDTDKKTFFDSLLFWTRHWLTDKDGAQMNKKAADEFFKLLETRSLEYVAFQKQNKTHESYSFILGAKVLSNMIGREQKDPLPIMHLWNSIQTYMKLIDDIWEKTKPSR